MGLGGGSREEKVIWQKHTDGSEGDDGTVRVEGLEEPREGMGRESCSQLLHDFLVRIVLSVLSSPFHK